MQFALVGPALLIRRTIIGAYMRAHIVLAHPEPFVAYGVEAGLRYSDEVTVTARLEAITREWTRACGQIETRVTVPFNRMAGWGADGRISAQAPVCSPFIRRRHHLPLE